MSTRIERSHVDIHALKMYVQGDMFFLLSAKFVDVDMYGSIYKRRKNEGWNKRKERLKD